MLRRKKSANTKRKLALANRIKEQTITNYTPDDIQAEQNGRAIVKHNRQVIHAPRINFTYRIGHEVVTSGKFHRHIG